MKYILAACLLLTGFWAQAIEEVQLPQRYAKEILPYMLNTYKRGSFAGVDRVKINYYFVQKANPDGVIVFSPGKGESSLKYAEFLYDMKDVNYSIFIIDHRGQGESGRLLPDPIKSHVNKFSDYVDDLSQFINVVVQPHHYRRAILMAHSMGGAIASGYLSRFPREMSAAILLAPMIEINTGVIDNSGADFFAHLLSFVGRATEYSPTQGPYDPNEKFEKNTVTSSRIRFQTHMYLNNKFPQLRIGGTTVNWVRESIEYTSKLRALSDVYQIPTVLFQSGKDQFVRPAGQNQICEQLSPQKCKIIRAGFEGSQHEILSETDSIRNRGLELIKYYIKSL
jgi:lysophospholipase